MEHNFWHAKWQSNQIGFHQPQGHPEFVKFFPRLEEGARVLVPLCGKSKDLIWLADQGYQVVGVELSEIAAQDFFKENELAFELDEDSVDGFKVYRAKELAIELYVGDFFKFQSERFDALYDRAALIALPESMRKSYADHCFSLLKEQSKGLVITTVYDQSLASGPPFSVPEEELLEIWKVELTKQGELELIEEEERWKSKGLTSFKEQFWCW